ncbi:hypothetical protein RCG17_22350 [Neobacillus sp. PS3-12]|jgi:O-antigen/teichoic acid export membrane protein|uniref:hypothetical protein n=1 Tax=Neobacillus sp. PS3-12 TaxID=3070677 RepID=UPI0027DFE45A|nr:hypothetical protein [Neobacillus sp. PS3-12]WML52112.1 hypothetical protein RCG17_22350 [Neobacillus sp. PS3-12]
MLEGLISYGILALIIGSALFCFYKAGKKQKNKKQFFSLILWGLICWCYLFLFLLVEWQPTQAMSLFSGVVFCLYK